MATKPSSILQIRLLSVGACLVMAACSGQEPRLSERGAIAEAGQVPPVAVAGRRTGGERAAIVAARQVGVPYRYGGNTAEGFDCSGLVQFAWSAAGKRLPRTTGALWTEMQPVSEQELEAGDLLFFDIDGKVSHVGLYLGSRRFVHAPSTGREVTVADLDSDYYRAAFIRGGRPR